MNLYNLKCVGPGVFIMAKFNEALELEVAYNLTAKGTSYTCDCPANNRMVVLKPCKHKRMMPIMMGAVNTDRFYNPETGAWAQPIASEASEIEQPAAPTGASISKQAQAEVVEQPQPPLPPRLPARATAPTKMRR